MQIFDKIKSYFNGLKIPRFAALNGSTAGASAQNNGINADTAHNNTHKTDTAYNNAHNNAHTPDPAPHAHKPATAQKTSRKSASPKGRFNTGALIIGLAAVLVILLAVVVAKNSPNSVSADSFMRAYEAGAITEAVIDKEYLIASTHSGRVMVLRDLVDIKSLNIPIKIAADFSWFWDIIILIFCIAAGLFAVRLFSRKMAANASSNAVSSVGADKNEFAAAPFLPVLSNTSFKDVAGIDDIKGELCEIVEFLKNPKAISEAGIIMPKGVLLVGPPGVGKTLVAKAVAGEANVPFFYESGASFVQIYVGVGAKRVRELFAAAKAQAPAIIFIDEIDAVGKARGQGRSDEREATLNELLTQMDGFMASSGVVVIAATNKMEVMDEALLRSGRFDRRLLMSLPDISGREAILRAHLKQKECEADIAQIAKKTAGFSGAALSTLVNEAAINAWRAGRKTLLNADFTAVSQKVLYGKVQAAPFDEKTARIVAVYQAAKAVAALKMGLGFEKIALLEQMRLAGEGRVVGRSELMARMAVCMAGSCGTKELLDEEYSIAATDIYEAKKMASSWEDYGFNRPGDSVNIINEAHKRAAKIASENREMIDRLAQKLTQCESLEFAQIIELLGLNED